MAAKVGEDVVDVIGKASIDEKALTDISNANMADHYALALTADNHIVQTFKYVKDGKVYFIQEPDPIVIYFDTARHFYKDLKQKRTELFSKLSTPGYNFISVNGDFYWYFSTVCNCVIFLFLSVEAFINKSIPNGFEYKRTIQDKRTEVYDRFQIQRNIGFLEKIKEVLPQAKGNSFVVEFTHKYELIKKLKEFRDEVVHTKSFEGLKSPNFYQDLYVMSLDFEFDKTLLAARDFINYYQENLIEECNCGND
ncbi:MAG: hypothetical protein ACKOXB_14665 [Flavobacteriales bacterium]